MEVDNKVNSLYKEITARQTKLEDIFDDVQNIDNQFVVISSHGALCVPYDDVKLNCRNKNFDDVLWQLNHAIYQESYLLSIISETLGRNIHSFLLTKETLNSLVLGTPFNSLAQIKVLLHCTENRFHLSKKVSLKQILENSAKCTEECAQCKAEADSLVLQKAAHEKAMDNFDPSTEMKTYKLYSFLGSSLKGAQKAEWFLKFGETVEETLDGRYAPNKKVKDRDNMVAYNREDLEFIHFTNEITMHEVEKQGHNLFRKMHDGYYKFDPNIKFGGAKRECYKASIIHTPEYKEFIKFCKDHPYNVDNI